MYYTYKRTGFLGLSDSSRCGRDSLSKCPSATLKRRYRSRCNTLQHTATHWSTLEHTAAHCSALQNINDEVSDITSQQLCSDVCNTLQHNATHCNTIQHTTTHCNTLQHTKTHCSTLNTRFLIPLLNSQLCSDLCNILQHIAAHCNTLQYTAAHFNTLQRISTHYQRGF